MGREVVPELTEGGVQLLTVDGARTVTIKVSEDVLPILDVFPESSELRTTYQYPC